MIKQAVLTIQFLLLRSRIDDLNEIVRQLVCLLDKLFLVMHRHPTSMQSRDQTPIDNILSRERNRLCCHNPRQQRLFILKEFI